MTPKDYALKLCQDMAYTSNRSSFNDGFTLPLEIAKRCALVAVDEILKSNPTSPTVGHFNDMLAKLHIEAGKYWQEVKTEIQNL